MKRPPGLWVLLSAGVLWLSLQDAYGIRASSLIFGKSTTTTTTTVAPQQNDTSPASDEESAATTDAPTGEGGNATKPTLTGNPQIDYVWDPNLPKELNGYNLSDYPFYERVPEDIDFKCDGLHDGFYASVKHKCQVYHHCLFGTRYDFLCANYTAFDQKTFICHFASEVDCVNSKKFWHRNDALYKAASTTTLKPLVIYTTAPPQPITPLPTLPLSPLPVGRKTAGAGGVRPFRRRRPHFDYYDDYYEEFYEDRPRGRGRKRIRQRPRPLYEDEYDDEEYYDEGKYERRGGGGRRRPPYGRRRTKERDRGKFEYEDEEDSLEDDEDYRLSSRRKVNHRKKQPDSDDEEEEDRYPPPKRKHNRRRPLNEDPPKNRKRRPHTQPDYDEDYESYERPKSKTKSDSNDKTKANTPPDLVKPSSGTVYDRPRVAPKIKPPVPKSQAEKYAYKSASGKGKDKETVEDYYDEYEDLPKRKRPAHRRPSEGGNRKKNRPPVEEPRDFGSDERPKQESKESSRSFASEDRRKQEHKEPSKIEEPPKHKSTDTKPKEASVVASTPLSVEDEYYDYYEDDVVEKNDSKEATVSTSTTTKKPTTTAKPTSTTTVATTTTSTTTTTTTTEAPILRVEQPLIRLVKRPFLPSRGGNPYTARGLQPVGARAINSAPEVYEDIPRDIPKEVQTERTDTDITFKPSPVIMAVPVRSYASNGNVQEEFRPQPDPRLTFRSSPNTQKPPEKNPLDINASEYDVTLNDALNPTLSNLPYSYPSYRGQQGSDQAVSSANAGYNFQIDPLTHRYDVVPRRDFNEQFTVIRGSYRPRQVQAQAVYSRY